MREHVPLVYFHGVVPGKYLATWPVFVVADHPPDLSFSVAVDDAQHLGAQTENPDSAFVVHEDSDSARRAYYTAGIRARLHQRTFRERVLEAYQYQCAFCRLRHEELLDAAHIVPDREPAGDPVVRNGLSLCKLHHAAFDRYFLGLRPDFVVEVRADILGEHDGPTLLHAIQGLHGSRIALPKRLTHRPAGDLVAIRYQRFLHAAASPRS
ncbi:MAG: HNH endonuclease [bacterium]